MDISKMKPDYTIKYIIVGNAYVGKSNIIYRFVENKFSENYKATINLDFSYKNMKINDKIFRIQLWDTAGQEEFQSISRGYYKSGACALVVYDITDRETFNNVSSWVEECKNNGPSTITLVLVGNKIDLEDKRQVTYEEGEDFANRNNMQFYETSALNGTNIDKLFNDTVESINRKIEENYYKDKDCGIEFNTQNKINLNKEPPKKKRKC
jgi:Ras-related protein Rab-2A